MKKRIRNEQAVSNSAIQKEARSWLLHLSLNDASETEKNEFESWYNANIDHKTAYDKIEQTWNETADLKELATLVPLDNIQKSIWSRIVDVFVPASSLFPKKGWVISAIAACFILFFITSPPQFHTEDISPVHYTTDITETKLFQLTDGSTIMLSPLSEVTVEYGSSSRLIYLQQGEVFFDVTPDNKRPFTVRMNGPEVTVLGTSFNIRRYRNSTQVSVKEGRVAYRSAASHKPEKYQSEYTLEEIESSVIIKEGQQLVSHGQLETPIIRDTAINDVGAWQRGRLIYVDELLTAVIEDLNRYSQKQIIITNATAKIPSVSASFTLGNIEGILEILAQALPIEIEKTTPSAIYITIG